MPINTFRIIEPTPELRAGLDRVRADFDVPDRFPDEVQRAADEAARRGADPATPRFDARDIEFVTIDPKGSRDLDQAYFAEHAGGGLRVRYAIADVAAFVASGDPVDREARQRGVTLYLPDRRARLHPATISEGAASLLPGEDRPALLWTIELDGDGAAVTSKLERALVRSREALSYVEVQRALDDGTASPASQLLRDIGRAREAQERARGGISIAVPTQEVTRARGGYRLAYEAPRPVENWNAQVSLLAGMCAAQIMTKGGVGILRTLPPPDDHALARLRHTALALGVAWPDGSTYPDVVRGLDPSTPQHAAFLTQAVRTLRGAGYTVVGPGPPPVHGALAAPYAHVTAPLRRLVDRYANEIVVALCAGATPPAWAVDALPALPPAMEKAAHHAASIERAVIDLVESVLLSSHIGDTFPATVVDRDDRGASVLIREPAIIARIDADDRALGDRVDVRVVAADPMQRRVELAAVR